jgi:hypothetical protein
MSLNTHTSRQGPDAVPAPTSFVPTPIVVGSGGIIGLPDSRGKSTLRIYITEHPTGTMSGKVLIYFNDTMPVTVHHVTASVLTGSLITSYTYNLKDIAGFMGNPDYSTVVNGTVDISAEVE